MHKIAVVVPCFNEARRLDVQAFERAVSGELHFVFVDDGSTDSTGAMLTALTLKAPDRLSLVTLPRNQGKAEAVRQGFLHVFARDYTHVGYWDADLATPLDEIPRLFESLRTSGGAIAFGSRVMLLGHHIERKATRHLLGRGFATVASWVLALPVYDTQCGAKLFVVTPQLRAIFAEPFESDWTFDVEILAHLRLQERYARGAVLEETIIETPLYHWRDVEGSKLRAHHWLFAARDLTKIAWLCRGPGAARRVRR